MVLLPGAGSHSLFWPVDLISALSDVYRVHAIDPIDDIGRSVSSIARIKRSDHLRMLDQLLENLAPDVPIVLMGGSRGAWLTAEYSLHAPSRLTAAIWLSPALVTSGWGLGAFHFLALSLPMMRGATDDNVDAMLRWILPRFAKEQPVEFGRMVRHTTVCYQCFDTRRVGRGFGPRRFSDGDLQSIEVPTLYLAGVDEKLGSSKKAVERAARVAPNVDAAVLNRAGHDLTWVRTDEIAHRVLRFLERADETR